MVKFSPLYMAGTLAGAGLALFIVFIVSDVKGFEFQGLTRKVTGGVSLLILITAGLWSKRLQGKEN